MVCPVLAATALALATTVLVRAAVTLDPLLITGARVLDVANGQYAPAAGVLIERGRIAKIYAQLPPNLPERLRRLDLKDATLVPGLGDMHAYGSPTSEVDADYFYAMGLAYGVTMYRVFDVPASWAVAQRGRIEAGDVPAPRMWTSGRGLDLMANPGLGVLGVGDAGAMTREVEAQAKANVDWISGDEHLPVELVRAMVTAAHQAKIKVAGRAGATSMTELVMAGVDSIEGLAFPARATTGQATPKPAVDATLKIADPDKTWLDVTAKDLQALTDSLKSRQTAVVPLLSASGLRTAPAALMKDPVLDQLPRTRHERVLAALKTQSAAVTAISRRAQARRLAFVKALLKAGALVLTGSDVERVEGQVPGIAIHQELAALVAAGFTPAEALKAATVDCATLLGVETSLGQIAPGFQADLFVIQGDPLATIADLTHITKVIRAGEVFEPKDLLTQARRAAGLR
jgi:imidazolonepropionase-like amidohydrolase